MIKEICASGPDLLFPKWETCIVLLRLPAAALNEV